MQTLPSNPVLAPAKVNLWLRVLGKREDGYHALDSLMAPVSIFDKLWIEPLPEPGHIEVKARGSAHVDGGEANLCHRAAKFYFEKSGVRGGVSIEVEKHIPVGAGMGGGSSDAASTIMALERIYSHHLDATHRYQAAFEVGADVPFFFERGPALVEGIGERVSAVSFPERLWLVLVHSGAFLSTGSVFSGLNIGLTTPRPIHTIMQFNFRGIVEGLVNDLEKPALALEPSIGEALAMLRRVGCPAAMMTGSGSAVFGVFKSEIGARDAEAALKASAPEGWRVEAIHTLDGDGGRPD